MRRSVRAAQAVQADLGERPKRRYQARIARGLKSWAQGARADPADPAAELAYLTQEIDRTIARLAGLSDAFARFGPVYERAPTIGDKRRVILDFAEALGARRLDLVRDRLAFRRWFDFDAVVERFHNRVGEAEMHAVALAERTGQVAASALDAAADGPVAAWRRLAPERTLRPLLEYTGEARLPRAGFQALAAMLDRLPVEKRESLLSHETARLFYQAAQDPRQDVWLQCAALELLASVPGSGFKQVATRRIDHPAADPDLFVRGRLAGLLRRRFAETGEPAVRELWTRLAADPSTHVRQSLCAETGGFPDDVTVPVLAELLDGDPSAQVRAAAARALGGLACGASDARAVDLLHRTTGRDTDTFVLRCCVRALAGEETAEPTSAAWRVPALDALDRLHTDANATLVRREAAMAAERLRVRESEQRSRLLDELRTRAARLRPGRRRRLPRGLLRDVDAREIGRVLAVLAQDDFSYEIGWSVLGPWIRRGERVGFRLWRLVFEARRPSPDKRQGYGHTRGRIFHGRLIAPSPILAELSPTKVPGEPLYLAEEGGWRPYLPLPDHAVSAVDAGRAMQLFTAEGVTTLEPPRGLFGALTAKARLSLQFDRVASARNWTQVAAVPPARYAELLRRARVDVRFDAYPESQGDTRARRFFAGGPLGLSLPALDGALWERFQTYFVSVYQNSLRDLLLFVSAAAVLFLGRRLQLLRRLARSRRRLPLVLGGWGTRGKSGTERLKAGLMNALGYSVFSKTTGCEAMFLFAPAHRELREMFLFRPYDKATIWEQANVARLADQLGTDVFLWECMGLTPSYVRILQSQWMRDDLATITNTYPDHEDLQGPAGRDIPYVMTEFIPPRSRLITSEEQMRPILRQAAADKRTTFEAVGWQEAGFVADDVLARFPYDEHPFNIALVTRMAATMGIPSDFALKEMADRVVPDLGVLKTFPQAPLKGRRLEFVNGMSANERYGALGNWSRLGFDRQDPVREPGVAITTVVNNRADRIARSRVFANMLVTDLAADWHVLIGGNLEGLEGYIEEAMAGRLAGTRLWQDAGSDRRPPAQVLADEAAWLRVVRSETQLADQLGACLPDTVPTERYRALTAVPDQLHAALASDGVSHAAAIAEHVARWRAQLDAYERLQARVAGASGPDDGIEQAFAAWWAETFRQKIMIVRDYHATGDQIVDRIAEMTPPGYLNRIMGVQNIKGTGLDFVYRWQSWEQAHAACAKVQDRDPRTVDDGLRRLLAFRDHGVLTYETVRDTVTAALARPDLQNDARQAALRAISDAAEAAGAVGGHGGASGEGRGVPRSVRKAVDFIEAFLDAGDAVRRRRKADRVYRDLVDERIGYDRATKVLLDLTKRQKGGWLFRAVTRAGRRV